MTDHSQELWSLSVLMILGIVVGAKPFPVCKTSRLCMGLSGSRRESACRCLCVHESRLHMQRFIVSCWHESMGIEEEAMYTYSHWWMFPSWFNLKPVHYYPLGLVLWAENQSSLNLNPCSFLAIWTVLVSCLLILFRLLPYQLQLLIDMLIGNACIAMQGVPSFFLLPVCQV